MSRYTTKNIGDKAEQEAVKFLEKNGHNIIEQNFYAKKFGEIDIITTKDEIYHFIEVKSGENFEAIYNITKNKLSKLYRSIDYYLTTKKIQPAYCVDAIIISKNSLEFVENISL